MVLYAEDGIAEFGKFEKGSECGEDIIIRDLKLTAVVPRSVWNLYGGCGKYFKVTCAEGREPCREKGPSVIVQMIDYTPKGGMYIRYTLTFEAFDAIAAPTSTRIYIRLTPIEEPGYVDSSSDEEIEIAYLDNVSDEEIEIAYVDSTTDEEFKDAYVDSTSDEELADVSTSDKMLVDADVSSTSDSYVVSTSDKMLEEELEDAIMEIV